MEFLHAIIVTLRTKCENLEDQVASLKGSTEAMLTKEKQFLLRYERLSLVDNDTNNNKTFIPSQWTYTYIHTNIFHVIKI